MLSQTLSAQRREGGEISQGDAIHLLQKGDAFLMKLSQDWLTLLILGYTIVNRIKVILSFMAKTKNRIHLPSLLVYTSVVSTPFLRAEKAGVARAGDVSGHRRGIATEISHNFGTTLISWMRPVPNSKITPLPCSFFDFTHADWNKKCFFRET